MHENGLFGLYRVISGYIGLLSEANTVILGLYKDWTKFSMKLDRIIYRNTVKAVKHKAKMDKMMVKSVNSWRKQLFRLFMTKIGVNYIGVE
ncbi:uncharacterized protein NESG_00517 [Nematocida ausubeli]|uniref:Uncharacterized protein n=1 Tax=Nematocida ausubeli (strain ATCC PRA-371 / ERTm2) TaxID=1913371 RepID=A0A086J5M0_NEMA1|nr:uncharacterized protein NESG_00517 [Nematocida ausubeli]KAI5138633.1 hypothetical protein NEAUS06_2503 [Nematocida ausubeli]KFG27438.1 hypothetical protein NESG_00517 [Nematocida ausubeli]